MSGKNQLYFKIYKIRYILILTGGRMIFPVFFYNRFLSQQFFSLFFIVMEIS